MRKVHEIAAEIEKDWKPVNFAARPYLNEMRGMNTVNDNVGADSGKFVITYFLSNASTWRGETAKRIKAELNKMIK